MARKVWVVFTYPEEEEEEEDIDILGVYDSREQAYDRTWDDLLRDLIQNKEQYNEWLGDNDFPDDRKSRMLYVNKLANDLGEKMREGWDPRHGRKPRFHWMGNVFVITTSKYYRDLPVP